VGVDRREERLSALLELVDAAEVQGLLVTHLPNIRYLTGFTGSAALLVVTRSSVLFCSDHRYAEQAAREVGDHLARIEIDATSVWDRLWRTLPDLGGLEWLGYEAHALTVRDAERLARGGKAWRWKPAGELVERLRVQKAPEEVDAIRRAAVLAQEALADVLGTVRVGDTELEIAARLEAGLRRRGSEWHPFPTIVASGPRSALPHARAADRAVRAGEWLLVDFGAQVDGYCADITRTVVVGARPSDRQRALYGVVEAAQRRARSGLKAGMTGREADALARDVIARGGWADAFGHSLGHGLGLEVHEAPRLSATNEEALPDGAVVTLEPGVYLPGEGGVRIEDDVVVTAAGAELLTDGRTELVEVGTRL
jgi:Xaa-Pro aminopeptidase